MKAKAVTTADVVQAIRELGAQTVAYAEAQCTKNRARMEAEAKAKECLITGRGAGEGGGLS